MQHGPLRNTRGPRPTLRWRSITPVRKPRRTRRREFQRLSSAGHPQNAEKETRKYDLKSQRKKHDSGDHDSQRLLGIERAKVMHSPILQTQTPRARSRKHEQNAHDKAGLESEVAKHFREERICGQQSL